MLDSVLYAREKYLKPTGLMVPSQCTILLSLFDGSAMVKDRIDFWDDVYGYKMEAMREEIYEEAMIEVVNASDVVSDEIALIVRSHISYTAQVLTRRE
jgi:protein arginine N-methyltransferase 3